MFWDNLLRRIAAVVIQINHAEQNKISNVAKSAYYRSAIILMCTIIEGLVYQLVKKSIGKKPYVIEVKKDYKDLQKLSNNMLGSRKNLVICEQNMLSINIDDNNVGFGKLNLYLKNKKIVNAKEYRILNKIRTERNKIHIQGINESDTGYTKSKFNYISKALPFLLNKLK